MQRTPPTAGGTPSKQQQVPEVRGAPSPPDKKSASPSADARRSHTPSAVSGPSLHDRSATPLPAGAGAALFLELGKPITTTQRRDVLVQDLLCVAREVSPQDAAALSRQLVCALGQRYIDTAELGAVVRPVLRALAAGQMDAEQAKALLRGAVQGLGAEQAADAQILAYLDVAAHEAGAQDISVLATSLYGLGEALGAQALASGRYQLAVDAIQLHTRAFPQALRLNLVQAFIDSLSPTSAQVYRQPHPASRSADDGKSSPLERVAKALVANPHWRKLETLLGQAGADPKQMRTGCVDAAKALGAGPLPPNVFDGIVNLLADGACRQSPQALSAAAQGLCEAFGGEGLDDASLAAFVGVALFDPRCGPAQAAAIAQGIGKALGAAQASPTRRDTLLDQVLGTPEAHPKRVQAAFVALIEVLGIDKLPQDERAAISARIKTSAQPASQQAAMIARLGLG